MEPFALSRISLLLQSDATAVITDSSVMHGGVAFRAKRNQVLLRILAGLATEFFVVDLKIGHCAARLASPAIATEHLIAQLFVQF